jgi:hypothetical protein
LITLGSILRMKFEAHVKTTILGQTFVSVEGSRQRFQRCIDFFLRSQG